MSDSIKTNEYSKILANIKSEILKSQYRAMQIVNKELIFMYWNIGKIILKNSIWGNKFVANLAVDLRLEFPNMQGFSERNLKYMRKLAKEYPDFKFVQEVLAQITWYHNVILMDKISDMNERNWYIKEIIKNGWSTNILKMQIKNKVYQRQVLVEKVTNFEKTLPDIQSDLAMQTLKDPYIFDFISLKGRIKEKQIEEEMLSKIKDVLLELGNGFAFVGNQYKVNICDKEYFIDLLFYHLELRCYIVVELKTREFLPIDVGQLNFYLSAVDEILRKEGDNPTIGIILCQDKNKVITEYALRDLNRPIGVSEYRILQDIPKQLKRKLPNAKDIELRIKDI